MKSTTSLTLNVYWKCNNTKNKIAEIKQVIFFKFLAAMMGLGLSGMIRFFRWNPSNDLIHVGESLWKLNVWINAGTWLLLQSTTGNFTWLVGRMGMMTSFNRPSKCLHFYLIYFNKIKRKCKIRSTSWSLDGRANNECRPCHTRISLWRRTFVCHRRIGVSCYFIKYIKWTLYVSLVKELGMFELSIKHENPFVWS